MSFVMEWNWNGIDWIEFVWSLNTIEWTILKTSMWMNLVLDKIVTYGSWVMKETCLEHLNSHLDLWNKVEQWWMILEWSSWDKPQLASFVIKTFLPLCLVWINFLTSWTHMLLKNLILILLSKQWWTLNSI